MSTPQTLLQTLPPHQHLDPHQRYLLPSPQDRILPPPRPSSNLSNSGAGANVAGVGSLQGSTGPLNSSAAFHQNIPTRPSSNLSNRQLPPPRPESGMSNSSTGAYHSRSSHFGSRGTATDYHYAPAGSSLSHQRSHDELSRANSTSSQHARYLPPPHSTARAPADYMPPTTQDAGEQRTAATATTTHNHEESDRGRKRRQRGPVDWVAFYGGRPPAEIIEIHDDDSPAPPTTTISNTFVPASDKTNAHHVDKRRRVNRSSHEAPAYSTTSTPYSYSNGNSTESLHNTTAATSLTSISSGSRIDTSIKTGDKRKREVREPRTRDYASSSSGRGYLAEYGEYVPPPKQVRKQKEVHVNLVPDRVKPTEKIDDDDGHYIVHEGSRLGDKYSIIKLLGQGTFGKVVQATELRTGKEVAVKIIRAVPKYRDASRIELRVLQTLRTADEHNRNRCIQLRDCFDWRGHICIVTPLLGLSVFDFLKSGGFVPFPGSHIQAFARQLLGSIAFLHDLNLIHTDLKPENILLLSHQYQTFTYNRTIPSSSTLNSRSSKFRRVLLSPHINLIDFGSATFDDEYHSSVVSTRHYRAPEIILGIGWSHPIDLWSLGCILVECWTGDALFQTHDCAEHLSMMQAVTGKEIDKHLVQEVRKVSRRNDKNSAARFFKNNKLVYPSPETPRQSRKFVRAMKRLEEIIPPTSHFNELFLDLLRRIFVYDPKKRITAREALKHPWFSEIVQDDGTEATNIRLQKERRAAEEAREREREREEAYSASATAASTSRVRVR